MSWQEGVTTNLQDAMIEIGSTLPDIGMVDIWGREANTSELSTTGIPVILVASASSDLCRATEPALLEVAKLDEGDYNVWGIVEGHPEQVAKSFPKLVRSIRLFAFLPGWKGIEELAVTAYPAVVAATRTNEVVESRDGWDPDVWEGIVNRLRAMLGWRPQALPRKLPPADSVVVKGRAAS